MTKYTSRGMRRRRNTDKWEITLSHKDPVTGEQKRSFHTVTAKTLRAAEKARDELIIKLELEGGAAASSTTIRDFMGTFLKYKEDSKTIEPSTVRGYKLEAKQICRYIGDIRLCDLTVADVNGWMAQMTDDGYAPKSVSKPFRLLKQALNWAMLQDLVTKNVCNFCKPPKRVKTPINALGRKERSRMLALARKAQPEPLGIAIELALTTGMRRGEVCALRWSDLGDDGTITVTHALGNGEGGFYLKEPKTDSSRRTIPLTEHTNMLLQALKKDSQRVAKELRVPFSDPFILGTQEPDSRPYNPTMLGKDFSAFCKMNGFDCTFHDLRHTFATMMIGNGCDVRTVASYLGHSSVTMTLNTYADVDPEAKKASVSKVEESFDDIDMSGFFDLDDGRSKPSPEPAPGIYFTVEQLEAMLEEAKRRSSNDKLPSQHTA